MAGTANEPSAPASTLTGIVLAAGAGRRAGGPKALRRTADGEPWLARAVTFLEDCGCAPIIVVLGASSEAAAPLVPASATIVINDGWQSGMSGSLRAGLAAASGVAVLVTLVDLPDLPASVGLRVRAAPVERHSLRQAVFGGRPGHPVLIGADHWGPLAAEVTGDHGARSYLVRHGVTEVECGDLDDGADIDN